MVRKTIMALLMMLCVLRLGPTVGAEEPAKPAATQTDIRGLAEQVDVLQVMAELNLDAKQLKSMLAKVEALRKKREELRKREESVLLSIKEPLQKMRGALVAGKEVPSSAERLASPKLKELEEIRRQRWQEFQSAVAAAVRLLDEGQVRRIARSPEAVSRAGQIVTQVRSASDQDWPKTLADLASELLEVKKLDKQREWESEQEKIEALAGAEKEKALGEFEKRKERDVEAMQTEISGMLTNIRSADQRILSVVVNNVAAMLRTKADVGIQLVVMVGRILDSPQAEEALRARLAGAAKTDGGQSK